MFEQCFCVCFSTTITAMPRFLFPSLFKFIPNKITTFGYATKTYVSIFIKHIYSNLLLYNMIGVYRCVHDWRCVYQKQKTLPRFLHIRMKWQRETKFFRKAIQVSIFFCCCCSCCSVFTFIRCFYVFFPLRYLLLCKVTLKGNQTNSSNNQNVVLHTNTTAPTTI